MISILLPTKNRPHLLVNAVAAVLGQEGPPFELIIDNGGGPVPTFDDPRVTVIERPADIRIGGQSLNRIAEHASGDLMHIACDDDVMQPGTLKDAAEKTTAWCYGTMQFITDGTLGAVVGGHPWSLERMAQSNIVLTPTVFWTRELFDRVGGFDDSMTYVWDYEMWARFGTRCEPVVRDHLDYHYEMWDGSVSSTHSAEIREEVRALQERWRQIGFGNRHVETV